MRVHSVLPEALTAAVDAALAGVEHVPHAGMVDMRGAELAAGDPEALALIGPFRSAAVAEAVEATAPAGLPLLAPVATWAGVTRSNEPCEGDPARHRGTVLRMLARDTEVAARLAEDVRAAEQVAWVVAGEHEYGVQLDGQLDFVGLPRAATAEAADLVVLCGLARATRRWRAPRSSGCRWSPSTASRAARRSRTARWCSRSPPATTWAARPRPHAPPR